MYAVHASAMLLQEAAQLTHAACIPDHGAQLIWV
jgi:hypothetical protein